MEIRIATKRSFSMIGKEGTGPKVRAQEWIAPLWQDANAHFSQIAHLVKYDEQGAIAGIWGAMSDVSGVFRPWDERGKYLAGCEVADGAIAPEGWTKWTIPAYRYIVADLEQGEYAQAFAHVIDQYMPQNGYSLAGAVHEHYPQPGNPEIISLYFPVERL